MLAKPISQRMCQRNLSSLLIGLVWLLIAQPAQAQVQVSKEMQQQVNEVAQLLEGKMDTTAQAIANPQRPSVQMTTCPVQANLPTFSKAAIFLYQEQALTDKLSQPYRQRLLAIVPSSTDRQVESQSFKLTNPAKFAGFCNKPKAQRTVAATDLGSAVCSVLLTKSRNSYLGETPSQGCPANIRGAVKITNQIELFPGGMNTWDRGFDANGKQVWGAQSESYQFKKQKE